MVALTEDVAQCLGLSRPEVEQACNVARLQDVGRLAVPDGILAGGDRTDRQRYWIGQVPAMGQSAVLDATGDVSLGAAVRAQHERWDGTGYPDRLAGEEIPLASRIAHVCETYLTIVSDLPQRTRMSPSAARGLVHMAAETEFCPVAARALEELLREQESAITDAVLSDSSAVASVVAAPVRAPRRRGLPGGGWGTLAAAAIGAAVGALLVFPLGGVATQCPPAHEGQLMCELQKAWVPAVTTIALWAFGAVLTVGLILQLPDLLRRARQRRHAGPPPPPPFAADPRLTAANWGLTYDDVSGPLRKPVWNPADT